MVSSDFRQLPGRFGEIDMFCECEQPDLSDRHTKVTAENLRSRRPEFFARAQGPRATRAEPLRQCDWPATREGSLCSAGGDGVNINLYICPVMKRILFIAMVMLCVAACGPRRASKTQESGKEGCVKDSTEMVQKDCCAGGNHGECDEMARGEECSHAPAKAECDHADVSQECKEVEIVNAEDKCQKESASEGVTVVQLGRKQAPKPIKPVRPLDRK